MLRLSVVPLTMQPPATIESMAAPRRCLSSKINLAGGFCGCQVQIGQLVSYRLSCGVT
ncbi:hypothetical protein GALL_534680 [mine drainage metagenome]|uniref:Uncharacterized protein n=1 Tax=mine drainage metagenome TaxID=410659 RepID=A0A1J5P1N3_9ZZZZ